MYIFYIDESGIPGKNKIYSAMGIPASSWRESLNSLISDRKLLYDAFGIKTRRELHAYKFINGRGNYGKRKLSEKELLFIYSFLLGQIVNLPNVKVLNAVGPADKSLIILEYLINRINRLMIEQNMNAILIFDNGNNRNIVRKIRKMRRFNLIPSNSIFGWGKDEMFMSKLGHSFKNIPIDRIVEDPNFRESNESYFIQIVDFIAYSLLRKECPVPKFISNGFSNIFDCLLPCLVKEANRKDAFGIIRVN